MIGVECPHCGEDLQFTKGTLKIYPNPVCPHCSNNVCGEKESDIKD